MEGFGRGLDGTCQVCPLGHYILGGYCVTCPVNGYYDDKVGLCMCRDGWVIGQNGICTNKCIQGEVFNSAEGRC